MPPAIPQRNMCNTCLLPLHKRHRCAALHERRSAKHELEVAPCMLRCSNCAHHRVQPPQQMHGIGTSVNRARSVGLGSSRSSHEADAGMCAIAPSTRRASAPADPKHSRSLAVTILLVRDEVGEAKRVRARAGKFGLRTSEVAKTGRKPLSFSHPESHPKPDPTPKPNEGAKTEGKA